MIRDRYNKEIAIILTIIYFIVCCISVFQIEITNGIIGGLVLLLIYLLPVVVVSCWYRHIKKYVNKKTEKDLDNKSLRGKVYRIIFILGLLGVITFVVGIDLANFINEYWNYLDKLVICVIIRTMVFVVWLLFLIWYSLNFERMIASQGKNKRKQLIIWMVLICFSIIVISFTSHKADDEWFKGLVERHNQEYMIEE